MNLALPIVFSVFSWWISTGFVLWLINRPVRAHRAIGRVTTILGIAATVAGAGITIAGAIREGETEREYLEHTLQSNIDAKYDARVDATRMTTWGIVGGSFGVACLVTSIVLLSTAPEDPTVAVSPAPGGATVGMGGAF